MAIAVGQTRPPVAALFFGVGDQLEGDSIPLEGEANGIDFIGAAADPRRADGLHFPQGWLGWGWAVLGMSGFEIWGRNGRGGSAVSDPLLFLFGVIADPAEFALELVLELLNGFEIA